MRGRGRTGWSVSFFCWLTLTPALREKERPPGCTRNTGCTTERASPTAANRPRRDCCEGWSFAHPTLIHAPSPDATVLAHATSSSLKARAWSAPRMIAPPLIPGSGTSSSACVAAGR
jgi:hypothetical protein